MTALRDQQGTTGHVTVPQKTNLWEGASEGPVQRPLAPIDTAPALDSIPAYKRDAPTAWTLNEGPGGTSIQSMHNGPRPSHPVERSDPARRCSLRGEEVSTFQQGEDSGVAGEVSRPGRIINEWQLDAVLETHDPDSRSLHPHDHAAGAKSYDASAPGLLPEHQKQDLRQRAGSMFQPVHMQPSQQETLHNMPSRASWAALSGETRLPGHAMRPASECDPGKGLPRVPSEAMPITVGHAETSSMDLRTWKSQLPLPPSRGPNWLPMAADGSRDGAVSDTVSSSFAGGAIQGPAKLVRYQTIPLSAPAVTGSNVVDVPHVTPSHAGLVPWTGYATHTALHEDPSRNQPRHSGVAGATSLKVGPCVSNGEIPVNISQETRASARLSHRPSIMDQLKQAKEGLAAVLKGMPLGEPASLTPDPECNVWSSLASSQHSRGPIGEPVGIMLPPSMYAENPRQRHEDPSTCQTGPCELSHVGRKSVGERSQAGPFAMPGSGQLQPSDAALRPVEQTQEQRSVRGPRAERVSIRPSNWSPERLVPSPTGMTTPSSTTRNDTGPLGKAPSTEQSRAPRSGPSRSFAAAPTSPTETRLRARQSAALVNLRTRPPISSQAEGPSDRRMWEAERVGRGSLTHGRQPGQAEVSPRDFTVPIGSSDMHGAARAEARHGRRERDSTHGREPANVGRFTGERIELIAGQMPESRQSLTNKLDHTLSQIECDLASLSRRAR